MFSSAFSDCFALYVLITYFSFLSIHIRFIIVHQAESVHQLHDWELRHGAGICFRRMMYSFVHSFVPSRNVEDRVDRVSSMCGLLDKSVANPRRTLTHLFGAVCAACVVCDFSYSKSLNNVCSSSTFVRLLARVGHPCVLVSLSTRYRIHVSLWFVMASWN